MAAAVTAQGQKTLEVAKGRGMIYDRNLQPLVNEQSSYRAAVMPTEQAIRTVTELLPEQSMGILELARQGNPFTLELPTPYVYSGGVYVFEIKQRYSDPPLAPHIVGYTDTAGTRGLSGIEKAYDTLLTQEEAAIRVSYQADVLGNPVEGTTVQVDKDGYGVKEGVVLTLDKEIQQICRDAALGLIGQSDSSREPMEKGGVLVISLPVSVFRNFRRMMLPPVWRRRIVRFSIDALAPTMLAPLLSWWWLLRHWKTAFPGIIPIPAKGMRISVGRSFTATIWPDTGKLI